MSKRFRELSLKALITTELPDDHSECEPPDPISNSEVKVLSADGSVGFPHVRVGHRQAFKYTSPNQISGWGFVVFGSCERREHALHETPDIDNSFAHTIT